MEGYEVMTHLIRKEGNLSKDNYTDAQMICATMIRCTQALISAFAEYAYGDLSARREGGQALETFNAMTKIAKRMEDK